MFPVKQIDGGVRFKVHLTPKAARDEAAGTRGDALKVRLTAPPVDGRANRALVKFIAKSLKTPASSVTIVAGLKSRTKTVAVAGVTVGEIEARLGRAP